MVVDVAAAVAAASECVVFVAVGAIAGTVIVVGVAAEVVAGVEVDRMLLLLRRPLMRMHLVMFHMDSILFFFVTYISHNPGQLKVFLHSCVFALLCVCCIMSCSVLLSCP